MRNTLIFTGGGGRSIFIIALLLRDSHLPDYYSPLLFPSLVFLSPCVRWQTSSPLPFRTRMLHQVFHIAILKRPHHDLEDQKHQISSPGIDIKNLTLPTENVLWNTSNSLHHNVKSLTCARRLKNVLHMSNFLHLT